MGEVAIIFFLCLLSEGISALLPFTFPASVISMMLLLFLLLTGVIKQRHIDRICGFLVGNMAFFFVAPCVGIMGHAKALLSCLAPFLFICILTTPIVYGVTGWVIQLLMAARRKKEGQNV
jgi:putative effector of murein hydrolase LrgA (UPF0299 family)